ncbi:hypothetical protein EDC24_2626 [Aquisalibacillus elongatus]|uniref:Uncharacterized protein n=2 Tax=Aquisalibacillus elongatus TaxID=485577 RepID=A0A3N5B063_9BACI|nr:hypothetical protein EDC24_2626 [Aquisalibacillus elongatus]
MDSRLQQIANDMGEKFGLESYELKRHHLDRRVNEFKETNYILTTEWFPKGIEEPEDGSNPTGAAVIEVDIHKKQVYSAVFVHGKTYADGIRFQYYDTNSIISWIEQETGLVYEKQFVLKNEREGRFQFGSCWNQVETSPQGLIEVQLDDQNRLVFYSFIGPFPSEGMVEEEAYEVEFDQVESIVQDQCRLLDAPDVEREIITPIYAIEEVFIRNHHLFTRPIISVQRELINHQLSQDHLSEDPYQEEPIETPEDVSLKDAWNRTPSPDVQPITQLELEVSTKLSNAFLGHHYAEEGPWMLETLHCDQGYLVATLRLAEDQKREPVTRKLSLFIDTEKQKVLNYVDNVFFLEIMQSFEHAGRVAVSYIEAYKKLKPYVTLTSRYVFIPEQNAYLLFSKLDCDVAVDATNGQIREGLDE